MTLLESSNRRHLNSCRLNLSGEYKGGSAIYGRPDLGDLLLGGKKFPRSWTVTPHARGGEFGARLSKVCNNWLSAKQASSNTGQPRALSRHFLDHQWSFILIGNTALRRKLGYCRLKSQGQLNHGNLERKNDAHWVSIVCHLCAHLFICTVGSSFGVKGEKCGR